MDRLDVEVQGPADERLSSGHHRVIPALNDGLRRFKWRAPSERAQSAEEIEICQVAEVVGWTDLIRSRTIRASSGLITAVRANTKAIKHLIWSALVGLNDESGWHWNHVDLVHACSPAWQ